MSIIDDALKKTQLKFKKKSKAPEKKPDPPPSQSTANVYEKLYKKAQDGQQSAGAPGKGPRGRPSDNKASQLRPAKKWFIVSAIVIICLLCSYGSLLFLSRFTPFQNFFRKITRSSASSRAYAVRRAPKKRKYRPGELILNGTSLIDGKRVALINDEIYQIGETINGKEIISITLNKIELSDDEKIITLKVH